MQTNLLRELRFISSEVGYREAKKMPIYERRWWIEEMKKEGEARVAEQEAITGRRTVDAK